jgi:hypothetical protein
MKAQRWPLRAKRPRPVKVASARASMMKATSLRSRKMASVMRVKPRPMARLVSLPP